MLQEVFLKEIVKTVVSVSVSQLKKLDLKLKSSPDEVNESISHHIREVKNWSETINFKDLSAAKSVESIYIQLDFFLYPKRNRISVDETIKAIPLRNIFSIAPKHFAILGQPGAGKTTSMKFFCHSILFDETFYPDDIHFPILIRLRDFNTKSASDANAGILVEHIFKCLGLVFDYNNNPKDVVNNLKEKIVVDVLNHTRCLVIVEGFDELIHQKHRDIVISELSVLANQLESSRIALTSRTADYNLALENVSCYELCPLNDEQITQFAARWLVDSDSAKAFVDAVKASPFSDATIRPLTIAHLCAIYERVGKIPDKPKTVYKRIISLLLEEWDEQRTVRRVSKYANFETDRKFEFLSALAYRLTVSTKTSLFNKRDLGNAYKNISPNFDLPLHEGDEVARELESHTGLFLEAGVELFEFAHKSLQEYLTAEYIVKLPFVPSDRRTLLGLANELAIAVSISSNPSMYFIEVTKIVLSNSLGHSFIQTFINRILIEKPEFNTSSDVGVYVLSLYSAYLGSSFSQNQLNLFLIDNLVTEFESLINFVSKRNPVSSIVNFYKRVDIQDSANGTKILVLELERRNGRDGRDLPSRLYCRESFLKESEISI